MRHGRMSVRMPRALRRWRSRHVVSPGHRSAARRSLVVLGIAAVLAASACGAPGGAGPGVTLRFVFWGSSTRAEVTNKAIAQFEARNPGIHVQTSFAPYDQYFSKLATEVAGGNAPDLVQMDYRYLREYADRGVLADLKGKDLAARLDTSKIVPGLLASGELAGKRLAVPFAQNTQVVLYDREKFAAIGVNPEQGWTWADYQSAATRISAQGGGKSFGTGDFSTDENTFEVWLHQRGKMLFTPDGKLGYDRQDVVDFWRLTADFRKSAATKPIEIKAGAGDNLMYRRVVATDFTFDNLAGTYWKAIGAPTGLAPLPTSGGELGQYRKPSQFLSATNRSRHQAEAAKLINFLVNDPQAGITLGTDRGMPVNTDIRRTVGASLTGADAAVFAYEERVESKLDDTPPAPAKGDSGASRAFTRYAEEIEFGRLTIEQAADRYLTEARQAVS